MLHLAVCMLSNVKLAGPQKLAKISAVTKANCFVGNQWGPIEDKKYLEIVA